MIARPGLCKILLPISMFLIFMGPLQVMGQNQTNRNNPDFVDYNLTLDEIIQMHQKNNTGVEGEEFSKKFPYFLKACASSQFLHKEGKDVFKIGDATSTGHATLYLSKVCLDKSSSYPRLILCDDIKEDADKVPLDEQGVGISSNVPFKTSHFIAVPHKMFWNGNVQTGTTFDEPELRKLIDEVTPLYNGIKFHNFLLFPFSHNKKRNDPVERKRIISYLIGSDYGLRINRNSYCQNLPITQEMMRDLVAYLNSLNDNVAAYDGRKNKEKYQWDPLRNNCAHIVHNSFSTFGVVPERRTNASYIYNIFHPTAPANIFIEIAHVLNNKEINPVELYLDKKARKTFFKYDWIPMQPFSFVEIIDPLEVDNKIYDIKGHIMRLRRGLLNPFTTKGVPRNGLVRALTDHSSSNKLKNLKEFQEKYIAALVEINLLSQGKGEVRKNRKLRNSEFKYFLTKLREHIENRLQALEKEYHLEPLKDILTSTKK